MSGSGKSSVIEELKARGYRAIDTDWDPDWEYDAGDEWRWREDRIAALLDGDKAEDVLFVSACVSNQGKFYGRFDDVVLLSAPEAVMTERLSRRTNNPYGKTAEQLADVLHFKETVEPLLRRGATVEIDTSVPLEAVVAAILARI
jgi:dephospho-CoA kinase